MSSLEQDLLSQADLATDFRVQGFTVNTRKLEHGFRRIGARIPYTLP